MKCEYWGCSKEAKYIAGEINNECGIFCDQTDAFVVLVCGTHLPECFCGNKHNEIWKEPGKRVHFYRTIKGLKNGVDVLINEKQKVK